MKRLSITLAAALPAAASALLIPFEAPDYVGTTSGVVLTGQQGWYLPVSGSTDYFVYVYQGNSLAIPQNPFGGQQFVAGISQGGTAFARAQRDHDFSGPRTWTYTYDVCTQFRGQLPATQNLGSFSLQDSVSAKSFIQLFTWDDLNTATTFSASYLVYTDQGTQTPQPGLFPSNDWRNLPVNHWYRIATTVDFPTNRVVAVSLIDLSTGRRSAFYPTDPTTWYLNNGPNSTLPLPTAYRFFSGGTTAGNTLAWDNLTVDPVECGSIQGISFNVPGGGQAGGSIDDLTLSDDRRFRTFSDVTTEIQEANLSSMNVLFKVGSPAPTMLDLAIEVAINQTVGGLLKVELFNVNTSQFNLIGQVNTSTTETTFVFTGVPAANYVNSVGEVRMRLKSVVNLPFTEATFFTSYDRIELCAR